jgi:hypothetical protein
MPLHARALPFGRLQGLGRAPRAQRDVRVAVRRVDIVAGIPWRKRCWQTTARGGV